VRPFDGIWAEAWTQLSAADGEARLDLEDLERLAAAAYLVGRDDEAVDASGRTYRELARVGDVTRAAGCAF
jgi:hypothetical protein